MAFASRGSKKTAGGGPEHAVERVHQDLDGLAGHRVAGLLGLLAAREQIVEQSTEDAPLAPEARPVGCLDGVAGVVTGRPALPDQAERIDLERADDARIQALEVEQQHVVVQAGTRLQHVAALHGGLCGGLFRFRAHGRRHHAPRPQAREIEEVERGDGGSHAVRRHPGEVAALHGKGHQIQLLQDVEHQARVGQVVLHEALGIVGERVHDPLRVAGSAAAQGLALAQNLPGRDLQGVALQAHVHRAQQADAVQHHPSRDEDGIGEAAPPAAALAQCAGGAAPLQRHPGRRRAPDQHRHVEVDDVPAGHHVGVQLADAPVQGGQQLGFAGARRGSGRAGGAGPGIGAPQEHFARAAAPERDREQALRLRVGLDVQRQGGQRRCPLRRPQLRLVEDHGVRRRATPGLKRAWLALDQQRAADTAVDQVTIGETHVRLEGAHPGAVQARAQLGRIPGPLQPHPVHRFALQRSPAGRFEIGGARTARPLAGAALEVEVGPRTAVAHQEGAAVPQLAVEMHDRAAAPGLGNVGDVEDEPEMTAHGVSGNSATGTSVPPCSADR